MPQHPRASPGYLWYGQAAHLMATACLVFLAWRLRSLAVAGNDRSWLGVGCSVWFLLALLVPILHQLLVWLAWRWELCFGSISRYGRRGFLLYLVAFFTLLGARPVVLVGLALADRGSIDISLPIQAALVVLLGGPAAYTGYSVVRFFGCVRAAGADHFVEAYRTQPLVRKGMFQYASNSMYTFAFLGLWLIGIVGGSWMALVAAAFQHAYIWVHYFCTERPDMRLIYGNSLDP